MVVNTEWRGVMSVFLSNKYLVGRFGEDKYNRL